MKCADDVWRKLVGKCTNKAQKFNFVYQCSLVENVDEYFQSSSRSNKVEIMNQILDIVCLLAVDT